MALAAKFLFHLLLFFVVFATYGLPISIIRDFYVAYLKLRRRLSAFVSYRRLTNNMDKRFQTVTCEEDFGDSERTCIICRDMMDVDGIHGVCKKLPYCGHVFHKHCLKEWLVQQQSCPTCRGDIQANEARAAREEEEEREREREAEQELEQDSIGDCGEQGDGATGVNGVEMEEKENELDPNDKNCVSKSKGYPILCKVTSRAPVVDFHTVKSSLHEKEGICQHFKRTLNEGTLIVCTDMKVWVWNELNIDGINMNSDEKTDNESMSIPSKVGAGVYLKVSDGWVKQGDITKLLVLKQD